MKRCPECRRDYYDDSLLYCLDDGAPLLEGPASSQSGDLDEPRTAILHETASPSEAATRAKIPTKQRAAGFPTGEADERHAKGFDKRLYLAPLLLIILALGGYVAYQQSSASKKIDSIAVMPFLNATGNPDLEYLSDGLTETLISNLAQVRELAVKPRTTVFGYKGKAADVPTLGREMNVETILTGKVAQSGNEIGLYIELIDAPNDRVLWSKDYKWPLSGLPALPSAVAREISSELRSRLSGADLRRVTKNYTSNPEAYQLYLKGRFHWNKRTKDNLYKALDHFRQAISLDPNYALAYAAVADVYSILGGYDFVLSRREMGERARENALRALALDDSLSQAHISLGLVLRTLDHNFPEAERHIRLGIELDPTNADGYNYLGSIQTAFGKMNEAEVNYKRAVDLEPTNPNYIRNYAGFLLYNRRYDESLVQLRKAIDLEPNFVLAHLTMSNVYQLQGKEREAVESYATAREILGDHAVAALMRESFAEGGWNGFIKGLNKNKWFEEFRPRYIRAGQLASIGEKDAAIAELEKAYEDRDGFVILLNIDPRLDSLRGDPRFQALVKKVGVE